MKNFSLDGGTFGWGLMRVIFYFLLFILFAIGAIGFLFYIAWIQWIAGVFFFLLIYSKWIEPRWLSVRRYSVSLVAKPHTWVRIAWLTDFHAGMGNRSSLYERLVKRVQSLNPDVVCLGGDYVENDVQHLFEINALKNIKSKNKYFILGNHDYMADSRVIRSRVQALGFQDLTNREIKIEKEDQTVSIVGLDDAWFGLPRIDLLVKPSTYPRILITHEADLLKDVEENSCDLVLLGHTHGGQIRIPFIGALYIPQVLSRAFDRGRKNWKKIPVVISQGIGEANMSFRFFCRPEIVIIDIGI